MPDALGLEQQQQQDSTTDYLGTKVPVSFKGQPTLPTGVGAPVTGGAGPSTIAGSGVAPDAAKGPNAFADFASQVIPTEMGGGASGAGGPGEGSPVGDVGGGLPGFSAQAGMFGVSGSPFGITGTFGVPGGPQAGLTVGPGTLSPSLSLGTITGNKETDAAISAAVNQGGKQGMGFAGLPSALSAGLLSALTNAPQVVGLLGSALTMAGAPITMMSLANSLASLSPTSVISLQNALNNPEAQITPAQALALLSGGAKGPTQGGPQAIGQLQMDNPVTNVAGTTQAGPTTPAANLADMTLSPTFAALANSIFGQSTARSDIGAQGPTGPPADIANEAISEATVGTGVASGGQQGGEGAAGPGPGDASDGGAASP